MDDKKDVTVINVRKFPVELHRRVKMAAAKEGISIQEWFVRAADEKLARDKDSK